MNKIVYFRQPNLIKVPGDNRKPLFETILLIASLIGALVTISDFFVEKLSKNGTYVIVTFLALVWCYLLINKFTNLERKITSRNFRQKFFAVLVYVIPILIIGVFAMRYFFFKESSCNKNPEELSIAVASFSPETNPDQPFSTQLIASLKKKCTHDYGIKIKSIPIYFDIKEDDDIRLSLLLSESDKYCIERGIITYGYWFETQKGDDLYNCYLFIKESEMDRKKAKNPRRILDSLSYNIQLPNEIFFEMPNYIDTLSEVIMGITRFYDGSLLEAKQILQNLSAPSAFSQNPTGIFQFAATYRLAHVNWNRNAFQSSITFYLGTIDVILGDLPSARRRYSQILITDSTGKDTVNTITALAHHNYLFIDSLLNSNLTFIDSLSKNESSPIALSAKKTKENIHSQKKFEKGSERTDTTQSIVKHNTSSLPSTKKDVFEHSEKEERESIHLYKKTLFGVYIYRNSEYKFGLADMEDNILTKRLYDDIYGFSDGGFSIVRIDQKKGFINTKGKEITIIEFADARNFQEGLAAVKIGDLWGFINTKGEMTISPQYTQVVQDFFRETAVVILKKKAIRIDKKGNKLRNEKLTLPNNG